MSDQNKDEKRKQKWELGSMFDRSSATYSQIGPPVFPHFGGRLVEVAQVPVGARVLDVACGRGAILLPCAEDVGPQGEVIGIDLSAGMVQALSTEIARRNIQNSRVFQMDAEELRFPDQTFDVVLCGFGLFFFPDLSRTLAEFQRVLKPGGKLTVSTWGTNDEQWDWIDPLFTAYLPDEEPKPAENRSPKPDFHSEAGMQAIFREAGIFGIQVLCEEADFVYASEEEWWESLWSHGARSDLERIEALHGRDSLEQLKRDAFEHLLRMRQPDGIHELCRVIYTSGAKAAR